MATHVHITGGTLAGIAAALRLAKAGHRVSLDPAGPLGGRARGHDLPGVLVDDLEPVITLPAAWRDLLKKSGRAFTAELARHDLDLVPAPAATHRWEDGTELLLPDDRGGQLHALRPLVGDAAADRWTALLDGADTVWQALRMTGTERPFPAGELDPPRIQELWGRRTLGQLARELRDRRLADLLLTAGWRAGASDPERAPAWLATRWTLPRTFGRWHLSDAAGVAQPLGALVEVLTDRLVERRVDLEPDAGDADARIDAVAPTPALRRGSAWARWRGRAVQPVPVRPPTVSHALHDDLDAREGIQESVFHTASGPVVGWQRTTPAGKVLVTSHDHTHLREADPAHGWDLTGWETWLGRPLLTPEQEGMPWRASAASHAGNEPWAELLSGALVTYEVHELLTGEDIRPTNKALGRARRA